MSGAGCYSWVDTLAGSTFPTPPGGVIHPAGTSGEVFQVQPLAPTLTTTIHPLVSGGVATATDTIVVAGTNLGSGGGAPASAALTWQLLGPVAPISSSCTAVDWTAVGVPVADTGTITATGNNTYTATPTSAAGTNLTPGQCYGFTETLAATTDSSQVTSPASASNEFVQVPPVPVIASQTSIAQLFPHGPVSDSVTITGTNGVSGTLTWSLVGPVAPISGSCTGVNWTGATALPGHSGTTPITGDGTVTTGPVNVNIVGCYSWVDTLSGNYPTPTTGGAGSTNEVLLVAPHQPTLTTGAAMSSGAGGTKSVVDTITVADSGIGSAYGTGAPASAALTWSLLGPVTPVSGSCATVDWTAAGVPVKDTGTITVTGDAAYRSTPPTALTVVGCYSYTGSLAATTDSLVATSAAGIPAETVQLFDPPVVATTTSATLVFPNTSLSDSVVLTQASGQAGTLAWSLVGPVAPVNGSCAAVTWTNAPTVPSGSGTVATTGDGTVTTGPVTITTVGCYSWVDTVTGPAFLGQTLLPAGTTNEVVHVQPFQPTLTTNATVTTAANGTQSIVDNITITGSGIGVGSGGAPNSVLTWTLYGPVAAIGGSCAAVNWTGVPVAATGTIAVTGDGKYTTPATTLTASGCYSFGEQLAGSALADPVTSPAGIAAETALVTIPPPAGTSGTTTSQTGSTGTAAACWPSPG